MGDFTTKHWGGKKSLMCPNNESCLGFLTCWRRCLHFTALCVNTHGFNNLLSSSVIDPLGHSRPFLISGSAWGSAFSMSFHIYILQHIFKHEGSVATSYVSSAGRTIINLSSWHCMHLIKYTRR